MAISTYFARFFFSGITIAALGISGLTPAQTSLPTEDARPVISPGRAGPGQKSGPLGDPANTFSVTIAEIMRSPQDFANRSVSVFSKVDEIFTAWSFKLDEDQPLAGGIDNDLLVVSVEPLVSMGFAPEWKNKKVSLTGTIRILQAADFRREYGRGVDDKLFRRFEGKPVLIAVSMRRIN